MEQNLDRNELQKCFELKQTTGKSFKELVNEYKQCLVDYFEEGNKLRVDTQTSPKQAVSALDTIEEVEGVYKGREHITQGIKKDGNEWILYKAKVLTSLSDKPLSFSTFNGCPGFDDLKEGTKVIVKFKSEKKKNKEGKEYTAKSATEFVNVQMDDLE